MNIKKWYKSKTIIFNTVTVLVAILTVFGYTPDQELAEITSSVLVSISPLVNIGLRFVTNKGIM